MEEGGVKKSVICKRRADDLFFKRGDELCHAYQKEGIIDDISEEDNDDDKRELESFPCCIPMCELTFSSLKEFEMHFNTCHRYICGDCRKHLPTAHLLDLHLCEVHDSYFYMQAREKPMLKCFSEACATLSQTHEDRRKHCIEEHTFPHDFRFNGFRFKKQNNTQGNKGKQRIDDNPGVASSSSNVVNNRNNPVMKGRFTFGHASQKTNLFVPRQCYQKIPKKSTTPKPQSFNNNVEMDSDKSSLSMNDLIDTLPSE